MDRELKQCDELFPGEPGLADKGAQEIFGEPGMVGHGQAPARGVAQNHVAAGLVLKLIPDLAECLDSLSTGTGREPSHTGTSIIFSVIEPGTGSPCFSKLRRYPWIASRMLAMTSSRV